MVKPDKILEFIKEKAVSEQQQMGLKNLVALFVTGSQLYGTNTETSDFDYEGVFIEDPEYVIGAKRCDEIDFSTNKENTRNTADDVDCKLYSLRKFMDLAKQNNPNKVEWFFIPEECMVYKNETYWKLLLEAKDLFLSKKIKHSFSGYAHSQKHKLVTKKKRLDELTSFKSDLEEMMSKPGVRIIGDLDMLETHYVKRYNKDMDALEHLPNKRLKFPYEKIYYKMMEDGADSITVAEKSFNFGMPVKNVYDYVTKEVEKYGQRTLYVKEYGYDLKFGSHLFRLYYEGMQLLQTGNLILPFSGEEQQKMMAIKRGDYSLDQILQECESLEPNFDVEYDVSKLRHHPDEEGISKLQMALHLKFWKETHEF